MSDAVSFENISYEIGKTKILKDITFTIKKGEVVGVLGPNGAGKSTLLSLINGLRSHSQGKITIFDEVLPVKNNSIRQRIGVVLQETALYEELTTFENLRFAASLYKVANPIGRIIEVLELLRLADRSDQIVSTLSGGLRRRIAIARALLHDPELLIIDEPTLGVDVEARHAIWLHLRFLKSKGHTVIVATNYLDEAQALCDSAAVLREGKLLTFESPDTLVARAGYCVDIECSDEERDKVKKAISGQNGVIRTDQAPSGLSIFLKSDSAREQIISAILKGSNIEGFRFRAPDLAEVFKTL